jgi:uncharacterized protein
LIDTNLYLERWPFRRLHGEAPGELVGLLSHNGIYQAWAGSFDALLHKDIAGVNARLAEACAEAGGDFFLPFGTVNPALPDWEEDLRRCAEEFAMPGIRLHPNYHGYALDFPEFEALLRDASHRGLIVQITVTMEDERMMHPLMQVPHVDTKHLADVLRKVPEARVVLLNAFRATAVETQRQLAATGRVWFDIAYLEGQAGLARLSERVPTEQIVFGSHAPLFYVESALLKLRESELSEQQLAAIQRDNAERLLKRNTTT